MFLSNNIIITVHHITKESQYIESWLLCRDTYRFARFLPIPTPTIESQPTRSNELLAWEGDWS